MIFRLMAFGLVVYSIIVYTAEPGRTVLELIITIFGVVVTSSVDAVGSRLGCYNQAGLSWLP
jgi:hypothetical protein